MKDIFRKDLKLKNKSFHRLFKILFIIGIIILIGKVLIDFGEKSTNHYKLVDKLESRLNDRAVKIDQLLKYGEKFERHNYGNAKDYGSYGKDELYCSNRLYDIDNIKYIINETGINNFNRLRKNKNAIDVESFSMLLRSTGVKCIITDNAEIDFLNPMREFDDFGFYRKNKLDYFFDSFVMSDLILEIFSRLFIYLIIVYMIYYKIILYIIYGSNKK